MVAPPINGGAAADAAAGGEAASPRSPQSPRLTRASSSRQYCAAALRRPGTEVWTWGRGDCGQLATRGLEDSHVPAVVEGLRGRDIVSLSAGAYDTAAVTGEAARVQGSWGRTAVASPCPPARRHVLMPAPVCACRAASRFLALPAQPTVSCTWQAVTNLHSWASGSGVPCRCPPACRGWRAAK